MGGVRRAFRLLIRRLPPLMCAAVAPQVSLRVIFHCLVAVAISAQLAACMPGSERPPCRLETSAGEVGSVCGFQNPEDLEALRQAGLIVVSNMNHDRSQDSPGFLSTLDINTLAVERLWPIDGRAAAQPEQGLGEASCTEPPQAGAFYPHGLSSRSSAGRTLLYVVAHAGKLGGREAVEIFELTGSDYDRSLLWRACVPTENAIRANDVTVTPGGSIVVSNYEPDDSLANLLKASLFGRPSGDVMQWSPGEGWRHVPGTTAAMANGVVAARDGERILYSETITGDIHRVPLDGGGGGFTLEIGGNPDNFTWTGRQTLLLATHTAGAKFMLCRYGPSPCRSSWEVYEIDPRTMASERVFAHDGERVGAVATALEIDGRIFLGAVFDDRVGVISLSPKVP